MISTIAVLAPLAVVTAFGQDYLGPPVGFGGPFYVGPTAIIPRYVKPRKAFPLPWDIYPPSPFPPPPWTPLPWPTRLFPSHIAIPPVFAPDQFLVPPIPQLELDLWHSYGLLGSRLEPSFPQPNIEWLKVGGSDHGIEQSPKTYYKQLFEPSRQVAPIRLGPGAKSPTLPSTRKPLPEDYGLFFEPSISSDNTDDLAAKPVDTSKVTTTTTSTKTNANDMKIADIAKIAKEQHDTEQSIPVGADVPKSSQKTPTTTAVGHKRAKRNAPTASQKDGETFCFLDYLLDTTATNIVRILYKRGYCKRKANTRTPAIVIALFEEFITKTEVYRALRYTEIRTVEDQYVIDLFNNIDWWSDRVDINGESFLLVDLIIETFLRNIINWLCDNGWLISDTSIEKLVGVSLEYMQQRKEYLYLIDENDNAFKELLRQDKWWLLEGVIHRVGQEKRWVFS